MGRQIVNRSEPLQSAKVKRLKNIKVGSCNLAITRVFDAQEKSAARSFEMLFGSKMEER